MSEDQPALLQQRRICFEPECWRRCMNVRSCRVAFEQLPPGLLQFIGKGIHATGNKGSFACAHRAQNNAPTVQTPAANCDAGASVVLQALNVAMDAQDRDAESNDVTAVTSTVEDRFVQRRADALTTMAETTLRHGPGQLSTGDRYQVVVHVTAETLADDDSDDSDGRCELDDGQRLGPDTVRRIACDGSLLHITEDIAGNPLDIGRKTRAVPPAMRRALQARDAGCRFPGCSHHRFVDAHHIEHWADGGKTSIDNLVLLCRRHHRFVHEGGFGLEKIVDGSIHFTRPDGRIIDDHPRLPGGTIEALCCANQQAGQAIDASPWIIPGDELDYGIAIGGLLSMRQKRLPPETITA